MNGRERIEIESTAILTNCHAEILSGLAVILKEMVDNKEVEGFPATKLTAAHRALTLIEGELENITYRLENMITEPEDKRAA